MIPPPSRGWAPLSLRYRNFKGKRVMHDVEMRTLRPGLHEDESIQSIAEACGGKGNLRVTAFRVDAFTQQSVSTMDFWVKRVEGL
jgi:hypothetical protein